MRSRQLKQITNKAIGALSAKIDRLFAPQNRSRSPARVSFNKPDQQRQRSQSPGQGCFKCGSKDHFIAQCPKHQLRARQLSGDLDDEEYLQQDVDFRLGEDPHDLG